MHRRRLSYLLLLTALPLSATAGVQLSVDGVDDPLKNALSSGLELSQYATREVSEAQLRRLYERAPEQAAQTLRPYGYYDAQVKGELKQVGKNWQVTLHVSPGEPVKIAEVAVQLDAGAAKLRPVQRAQKAIERLKGQTLDDGAYTTARDGLSSALTAYGFLDAKLLTHRVEVNRAQHSATIDLAWQVGQRYRYGNVHFTGSQFHEGFLKRYVPFKRGDYFDQSQLLRLQQALNGADYFSVVNVVPDVDGAKNGVIDIQVELTPAKRTVYTGGPLYGTDVGAGVQGGIERRWVNRRGHTWTNKIVLAQRLKTLSSLYSIPLPGQNQRSLNFGAIYNDSNTDTSQEHTLELIASETELWHGWTRTVGLHALTGTFAVGATGNESDTTPGLEHGRSTLVYPELTLSRKQADNTSFVRHGWSLTLTARSTAGTFLSDARFSQWLADGKWIYAFAGNNRLILHGIAGMTWTNDFADLPPQLRFFAGGENSVRGYAYQALGPLNASNRVIGGENLLVASTSMEHYFTRNWGMAFFVDAGNAFTGTAYHPAIGTGLGLRWLSPVGMVRVDLGTPIHNDIAHGIELGVSIGPDL